MKRLSSCLVLLALLSSGSVAGLALCPSSTPTIDQIQGVKSTTAEVVSPCAGQTVTTSGIVTAITGTGFFIEEPGTPPAGLTTGIYINTGSTPSVAIKDNVTVTGTVSTVPAQSHIPATEIAVDPVSGITVNSTGTLPAPVTIDASKLSATGGIYQLTPYEGMRVSFASLTAVSGTGGTLNEAAESYTSNGQFYAVITSTSGTTARPFRAPGIDLRDAPVPNTPANVAVFNDNPQRILIDSGTLTGSTPIDVATGAVLTSVTGVLDFTSSADSTYTPARLLVDPSYSRSNVDHTFELTVQPVPATASNQFTIVSLNLDRFFNTSSSDDIYYVPPAVIANDGTASTGKPYKSNAVDVTTTAYQARLTKTALAICNVLNTPDIIALEGIENQSVATDIAAAINTQCSVQYSAYSTDNTNLYTLDSTGISTGFLLKNSTVEDLGLAQGGACQAYSPASNCEVFTPTTGSSTPLTLNARPWLFLNAGIKRANAKDYSIVVVLNDLADLAGENSATSTAVREQKEIQAEEITTYIQTFQTQGVPVISVGNFNAFEFSDGYTDTLATYTNNNVLPATQVVQPGKSGLVTPALDDLTLTLPQTQRWSYVDNGNAEVLDHFVITSELASTTQFNYVHFNADFPADDLQNTTIPTRVSSHDAAIGYFVIPVPVLAAFLSPHSATFNSPSIGTPSAGQQFSLSNVGEAPLTITSITISGDFAESNNCGSSLALNASCTINVVFTPTANGTRTGTLSVATSASATAATSALTGNTADFTLADSSGNTTTTVTVAAGATGTASLVFTPVNGFSGTIATTCTAQGAAPAGVSCTPPAGFALSGTAAVNQSVSFTTTARTAAGGFAPGSITRSPWSAALVLGLAGLMMFLAGRTRRLARLSGLLMLLLAIFLPAIGCSGGGGNNGGGGGGGGGGTTGTPAGTYTYTVTATSGSTSHAETVKLVVQ